MKKIILLITLFTACTGSLFSQCQPDDSIGKAYIYPEKISFATDGQYYNQVITFRVPADSDLVYNGTPIHAVIDSARLLYIGGIPAGFNYACNITGCTWPGGTNGCALLEGISDGSGSSVGDYPIKIYLQTWFKAAATPLTRIDSSSNYTFKILAVTGIFEPADETILSVYPNPSSGKFRIEPGINQAPDQIQVIDMNGKICFTKSFNKERRFSGNEEINLESAAKGLYLVILRSGNRVITGRITIQ